MVVNKSLRLLLLSLVLLVQSAFAGDSINVNSFNISDWYKISNLWMNTSNIAGLSYNSLYAGEATSGYNYQDGDFIRSMDGDNLRELFLHTKGYQKINKLILFGEFAYSNSDEKNTLWNGTFDPYRGNPYIVGDSVSGANYHRESYYLSGGLSSVINSALVAGIKVDYKVCVGAKQKDPRPENVVNQLSINPGIIFQKSKIKIGADIGYLLRKEENNFIQYVTDNPDPTYFYFKGFGFYSSDITANHIRFQSQNSFFGGIQLESNFNKNISITELRANYSIESIDDGSTVIKKEDAGDWKELRISLNEQLKFYKNKTIQLIKLNGNYFNGKGIEYTQDLVYEGSNHQYVTVAKNMKIERNTITGILDYNLLTLNDNGSIDWNLKANTAFKYNQEKYYYIPEIFSADYMNLSAGVGITKNIYTKKLHLAPGINTYYNYNISSNMYLPSDPEITKKQIQEIYIEDFNYFKADILNLAANLKIGLNTTSFKNLEQIYLNLSYNYSNAINLEQTFGIFSSKIGFVF